MEKHIGKWGDVVAFVILGLAFSQIIDIIFWMIDHVTVTVAMVENSS